MTTRRLLLLTSPLLVAGCWAIFPRGVTMNEQVLLEAEEHPKDYGRGLVVLFPGRDSPERFVKTGFVDLLERSRLPLDLVAADAHPGFFWNETILERMHEDVLVPAREKGYSPIYLAGISLGAVAAGLYAMQHPDVVKAVLLVAPSFDAGVVLEGKPPKDRTHAYDRALWSWVREHANEPPQKGRPLLYLGFGDKDRRHETLEVLARSFPPERVYRTPGCHDWPAFRASFRAFLDDIKGR
jgi:pimeloyl-ACP methyl ester carboxylesterase